MIEINPQEVMVIAQQMLEGGWIQGAEKGRANSTFNPTQDPQGVCVVGALRESLTTVLRPQIEASLIVMPEFMALPLGQRQSYARDMTARSASGLLDIFRTRIEKVLGQGSRIESWNDASSRQKNQVLDAMRKSLDVITGECMEVWSKEAESEKAKVTEVASSTVSDMPTCPECSKELVEPSCDFADHTKLLDEVLAKMYK